MPRSLDPFFQTWEIWVQGSRAAGYVASTTYFFEFIRRVSKEDSKVLDQPKAWGLLHMECDFSIAHHTKEII
jgi:hypothetical protein